MLSSDAGLTSSSTGPLGARQEPEKLLNWDHLDDTKRFPSFSMRFTEREVAALKHIAKTTPDSMHGFCIQAIRVALNQFIEDAESAAKTKASSPQPGLNCPSCQQKLHVVAA